MIWRNVLAALQHAIRSSAREKRPIITTTAEAISVGATSLNWAEISEVVGFKRDLLTWDEVCLEFTTTDGRSVAVTEKDVGWDVIISQLPNLLPGFPAVIHWWKTIEQPPFATNMTKLYERHNDQC